MDTALAIGSSDEGPQSSESATPSPEPAKKPIFAVELRAPPKYTPGCGPELQPLRLLPLATCTTHIIERILLPSPGLAADGKPLPKRMTYIVGWRDLPAASLLVPAMQILDYVSPKALEDWEEALEAELDENRTQLAREKLNDSLGLKPKHKARPPTHTGIETAAAIEPESGFEDDARPKTGAMSLSTPKKRKLADFEGLSDDDESPSNQIAREMFGQDSREDSWDMSAAEVDREGPCVALMDDAVDEGMTETPKRSNATYTPVPLPPYVTGIPNLETSIQDPKQTAALKRKVHIAVKHGGYAVPVASTVATAPTSGAGQDVLVTHEDLHKAPSSRNTTKDFARSSPPARQPPTGERGRSSKKPKPPRPAKRKRKAAPPSLDAGGEGEAVWEVERLEDMAMYDVEGGGLERHFLVRWAGNWPADQQLSWEPEHNIPSSLIRNYFKMAKAARAKRAAKLHKPPQPPAWSGMNIQYSSVNEMFEFDSQDNDIFGDALPTTGEEESYLGQGDLENEVFVVEEENGTGHAFEKQTAVATPRAFGVY